MADKSRESEKGDPTQRRRGDEECLNILSFEPIEEVILSLKGELPDRVSSEIIAREIHRKLLEHEDPQLVIAAALVIAPAKRHNAEIIPFSGRSE